MSWGNSASGTKQQVLDTCAKWAPYVAECDRGGLAEVAAAHQTQVKSAIGTTVDIVESYPEGSTFSISASGSCGSDGKSSCQVWVSYSVTVPAAATADEAAVTGG